jgi:hypothetical protein
MWTNFGLPLLPLAFQSSAAHISIARIASE